MKKLSLSSMALLLVGVLFAQESRAQATLQGHSDWVTSVSFSPDGLTLVSGSWDHTIRLWNMASQQEIATLQGHSGTVSSVSFSPDGLTLVSGSWDHTIRLWNMASQQEIATLQGHSDWVRSVSFSPDGLTLASGGWDHTIRLWNMASQQEIATLQGHSGGVTSVSFSPDGLTLASGSWDHTIRLWNVASQQEIATLQGHSDRVRSVSFSPDGLTLASGGWDHTIRLWNVASQQEIATLQGHSGTVSSVSFSPDGLTLASGSWDHTIRLWNVASQQEIATLQGHSDWITSVSFSPDGLTLVSSSVDNTIRLWNIAPYATPSEPLVVDDDTGEETTDTEEETTDTGEETADTGAETTDTEEETADDIRAEEAAVVEVTLVGEAIAGLTVEFARSIAGREPDYAWAAVSDAEGRLKKTITPMGRVSVNGYYWARALTPDGEVVGQWQSIALNKNRRYVLELTLGGGVRVVDVQQLVAAKVAAAWVVSGLQPNVPNPFNSRTQIAYRLAAPGAVRLEIYNALGQRVRTLVDQFQVAGEYQVSWDARDGQGAAVSSGVYVTRLYYPSGMQTRRLLLLK